jgi:hypothetical protein
MKLNVISERRLAANKANAQKSTGPKTPEGKARSSQNAVRHGLSATTFIVFNEDLEEYTELREDYMCRFAPRDRVEIDLIERMVHAAWNLRRTWNLENETINLQMFRMEGALEKEYIDMPERSRLAAAFEELAKQPALPLLHRYEARQSGEYQRALKTFLDLRKSVPLAPPGPLRGVPEQIQAPPTAAPEPPAKTNPVVGRTPSPARAPLATLFEDNATSQLIATRPDPTDLPGRI